MRAGLKDVPTVSSPDQQDVQLLIYKKQIQFIMTSRTRSLREGNVFSRLFVSLSVILYVCSQRDGGPHVSGHMGSPSHYHMDPSHLDLFKPLPSLSLPGPVQSCSLGTSPPKICWQAGDWPSTERPSCCAICSRLLISY